MKRTHLMIALIALGVSLIFTTGSIAAEVPVTLVSNGFVGDTLIYSADLSGIAGLTTVGSIKVVDDGTPVGGSPGIFSGFDLDAVFLDADGLLSTTGDRFFASSFLFSAGTTRPTSLASMLPNAAHPGPTFGSLDANTIDLATATLNTLDGVSVADVNVAAGFLTLGDGGMVTANFSPTVPVSGTLYLLAGEVGGQAGEGIGASVFVSETPIPEPSTWLLLGSGLAGVAAYRLRQRKKS